MRNDERPSPSASAGSDLPVLPIPMSGPDLEEADATAVAAVLRSGMLSIGPKTQAFEEAFAAYVGTRHAVAVSSGTAGLHLGVIAAGVSGGDLVITSPFSFVASANVLLYEHAHPIFVDIDPDTLNIDAAQAAEAAQALTGGTSDAGRWLPPSVRATPASAGPLKAILPVDVFGQPAHLDAIMGIARLHGLPVIEDACEAIGAEYKGSRVGATADASVFAFYPNKQMTTGEGGIVATDRDDWADLFRSLRNQGRDKGDTWLSHSRLGYNYRLDEMSAALGIRQLARIEELLAKRQQVADWYGERLGDVAGVALATVAPETTRMSWFVYVVRLDPAVDRDRVAAELAERGVPTRSYFAPLHLLPFYRERFGFGPGDFPVTEAVAASTLALPFSGTMSADQVDYVATILSEAMAATGVSR